MHMETLKQAPPIDIPRVVMSSKIRLESKPGDFTGGPGVKKSAFQCRDMGSILGWGAKSHLPQDN